jgi:hypothetical protein
MTGIPSRYWRVCDRCGEIVSIASDDPSEFVCSECGSTAAWEYDKQSKAMGMRVQILTRVKS